MRNWSRYLAGVVIVSGLLATVNTLHAESCSLELKKVDAASSTPANYIVRSTYPNSFMIGLTEGISFGGPADIPKFADVIDTEPDEYNTKHPARGVLKLGSQHFGYVLDSSAKGPDDDEEAEEEVAEEQEEEGSLLSTLSAALFGFSSPRSRPPRTEFQAVPYDRLYFDSDHDGDLTDEEVIEASPSSSSFSGMNYFQTSFDSIDVTFDIDSTSLDYAFNLRAMSQGSSSYGYVSVSVSSATYREGEITVAGKKYPVFLIDYNSNGRFDDQPSIDSSVRTSNGSIYMKQGDRLYLDSGEANAAPSGYGPATEDGLFDVNKLIQLDGKFYDLTISPAGDELSIEPSDVTVGYVSNPNPGFSAVVYGEEGFLKIESDESGKAPLPAGEWKLQGYVIDYTGREQPKEAEADESLSVIDLLSKALGPAMLAQGPRLTRVSASATTDFQAVKVVEGKTVEMLFGPPYRPVVDVQYQQGDGTVSLGMSLVGLGNEICSDMMINGGKPGVPKFTITTADGQVVDEGEFEYG